MAFKTFTSGAVLTAAEVNTYLMQQAVIVCTSSTRPSAPTEGMKIFETDTDIEYTYSGSAWVEQNRLGAWSSYTPTHANLTVGNGTEHAFFRRTGRTIQFRYFLTWGSTTSASGNVSIGLPVAAAAEQVVACYYLDSGTRSWPGTGLMAAASALASLVHPDAANSGAVNATAPFTWTTNDQIRVAGNYEASS